MVNKHLINMREELTKLFQEMPDQRRRRVVGVVDSVNLLIVFLDQELQIAAGMDRVKAKMGPEDICKHVQTELPLVKNGEA